MAIIKDRYFAKFCVVFFVNLNGFQWLEWHFLIWPENSEFQSQNAASLQAMVF
jgi:hypothetical protein